MDTLVRIEPEAPSGGQRVRLTLVALLSALYLLNLTGGLVEIPDFLPVVGNLDEVAATLLLMRCLERLGFPVMPTKQ